MHHADFQVKTCLLLRFLNPTRFKMPFESPLSKVNSWHLMSPFELTERAHIEARKYEETGLNSDEVLLVDHDPAGIGILEYR